MSDLTPTTSYQPSAYYVVVGSFKIRSNANAYRQDMQGIFGKAEIIRNGEWNYVCVGGQFGSSSSARATLSDVKSQLVSSGGDESEDEESSEEEEETDESEDYDEESDEDLGDEDTGGSESRGQAWVLGI
ncbi:MAG: SPOR domain-containing protein [Prevotellaceae bacterium]|nr:SPOR domain-containing protein [Prevotellaceae bacterium]